MKYFIKTFGCQMNYADSERINAIFRNCRFERTEDWKESDVVVLNTCSVKKKGEDKVLGLIREIKKTSKILNKNILVGITGCMVKKTGINKTYLNSDLEREKIKEISLLNDSKSIFNCDDKLLDRTIDFVFRIEEVSYIPKILSKILGDEIGNDVKINEYLLVEQLRENHASANIVIQTGCDNFCTYCIVPYTRGREKSREINEIISEIQEAVNNGAKEVTLIGQNVNSYGKITKKKLWNEANQTWNSKEIQTPFGELLAKIDEIKGIDRIRFTSSNPHDMTYDILDSHFKLNHTCNHLHFALQSGDDEILRKMGRKHIYNDFKTMVDYLRSKDPLFSITTDIIVGFPGETEEQFQNTVQAFKEIVFDFVYISRYSERSGTYAAKNIKDNISNEEKARRWDILNTLLFENVVERNKLMIGREEEILITGRGKRGTIAGRTRNYKEVLINFDESIKVGDLIKVKITGMDGYVLRGEKI